MPKNQSLKDEKIGIDPHGGRTSQEKMQSNKERASRAIHLNKFAHSKSQGTRRAIQKYRDKQQTKFLNKARLLRNYKKTMTREGYEPGQGASRRRDVTSATADAADAADDNDADDDDEPEHRNVKKEESKIYPFENMNINTNKKDPVISGQTNMALNHSLLNQRKRKMDPFAKAKAQSQRKKLELEQMRIQREQEAKRIQKKKAERKVRTKHMMERTRKTGQPVMKHVIQGMLDKIRKDCTNPTQTNTE